MKKIFFIIFATLLLFWFVSADSDYEDDYTLIDCINWDNNTWVVFDSEKPYATLKEGIENTISYINTNINISWNEETSSWKVFNIKVQCSFNDVLNQSINLDYNWVDYNNELIIEWIEDNSFILKEVDFQLWHKAWNITFKNAQFLNENKPYFYDFIPRTAWVYETPTHPLSNWVKILNSYIEFKNWNNLWDNTNYKSYSYIKYRHLHQGDFYNYSNKQIIENSIIDIEISNDFSFRMPIFVKNSKITFSNLSWTWIFDISFLEDWNIRTNKDFSLQR